MFDNEMLLLVTPNMHKRKHVRAEEVPMPKHINAFNFLLLNDELFVGRTVGQRFPNLTHSVNVKLELTARSDVTITFELTERVSANNDVLMMLRYTTWSTRR